MTCVFVNMEALFPTVKILFELHPVLLDKFFSHSFAPGHPWSGENYLLLPHALLLHTNSFHMDNTIPKKVSFVSIRTDQVFSLKPHTFMNMCLGVHARGGLALFLVTLKRSPSVLQLFEGGNMINNGNESLDF